MNETLTGDLFSLNSLHVEYYSLFREKKTKKVLLLHNFRFSTELKKVQQRDSRFNSTVYNSI